MLFRQNTNAYGRGSRSYGLRIRAAAKVLFQAMLAWSGCVPVGPSVGFVRRREAVAIVASRTGGSSSRRGLVAEPARNAGGYSYVIDIRRKLHFGITGGNPNCNGMFRLVRELGPRTSDAGRSVDARGLKTILPRTSAGRCQKDACAGDRS